MVKVTLAELLEQRARLEEQIALVQREERAQAIARVRAQMAEYGLTLADIAGKSAPMPGSAPRPEAERARKTAAVKYRDSATGSTWAGRGLQPRWLREALGQGRSLSEFLV